MTGFIDELLAEVIGQQVALMSAVARLEARTDGEALHDLRIALRRLRSLLRPIRGVPGVEELEHAAAEIGRLSGPIRDLEVLLPALAAEGLRDALAVRRPVLESGYVAVLASQPLHRLQLCLDVWPALLRTAQRHAVLDGLHGRVRKRLRRQWKTLRAELAALLEEKKERLMLRERQLKEMAGTLSEYNENLQKCFTKGSMLEQVRADYMKKLLKKEERLEQELRKKEELFFRLSKLQDVIDHYKKLAKGGALQPKHKTYEDLQPADRRALSLVNTEEEDARTTLARIRAAFDNVEK